MTIKVNDDSIVASMINWYPVDVAKPTKPEPVLVTIQYNAKLSYVQIASYFGEVMGWQRDYGCDGSVGGTVTAWAYLPDPYDAESIWDDIDDDE